MRSLYPLLVGVTIASVIWVLLIGSILPMGPVDQIYVSLKLHLFEKLGDADAGRILSLISRVIVDAVRTTAILIAVPLLLTNIGWGVLCYRLLRKTGDL